MNKPDDILPQRRSPRAADFDGHLDRPFESLTADEKLDWLWSMMCLLYESRRADGSRIPDHIDRREPRV